MKRILTASAFALMMSTTAIAGSNMTKLETYRIDQSSDIYASNFIGMRVYAAEKDYDALDQNSAVKPGVEKDWEDIGEVDDVILSRDGKVKAVILGVGGFIGVGEKDVAVDMKNLKLVREEGDDDDYFLVIKASKESLTEADEFKRQSAVSEPADQTMAKNETASETTTDTTKGGDVNAEVESQSDASTETTAQNEGTAPTEQEMAENTTEPAPAEREMLRTPSVELEGYYAVEAGQLKSDELVDAPVYDANNEHIGEVNEVLLSDNGAINGAVIDVGGFLGIGEHSIAVSMDELRVLRTDDGDDIRVYIDATQEELEKQPEYEG